MKTVLVTGPIGGGKSACCHYLRSLGYPVYDCDSRCKALYEEIPGLKSSIEKELGIPFQELGRIFTEPLLMEKLEALVYPLMVRDIESWKSGQGSSLLFIESAVAHGKEIFRHLYDSVLLITADYAVRLARNPDAALRDRLQHFSADMADYTIINGSSLRNLHDEIDEYLDTL